MADYHHDRRKVYALGETILDLVSDGGFSLQAVPGGSVLNASVSLGRMGIAISLISEFGADTAGNLIDAFLKTNGVHTDYCIRYPHNKTSLALAFLDRVKNASYSFYHDSPEQLTEINIPVFQNTDILLFGSLYSVKPDRRFLLLQVLQKAVQAKSVIYYDLNIRKINTGDMDSLMPSFLNNMAMATIVKGSDEDFYQLFGLTDTAAIYEKVRWYCEILIITAGSNPVKVFTPNYYRTYRIEKIIPVSTIGAGDNFNAGFIFGFATSDIDLKKSKTIPVAEMDRMIGCGLSFATETCLTKENYIQGNTEPDFWKQYI
jgi:fructokinase